MTTYYLENSSNIVEEDEDIETQLSSGWTYLDLVWTLAFSSIVVTSLLGNCLVIWIVTAHRRMWSVTNYFLLNLAVADILMATFNCIFSFIYMRDREWHYGSFYCSLNQFISLCSVPSSVFTMLAITLDRRRAIMSPLHPRTTRLMVLVTLVIIWSISSIIALPPSVNASTLIIENNRSHPMTVCIVVWSDGSQGYSKKDFIYNLLYFILTYCIPLVMMALCYLQMGKKLWGQKPIGEDTPSLAKCRKTKQKIVKMFGVVTTIFAICWLPYHAYFIIIHYHPSIMRAWYTQHMYLVFYWLAMFNCCVNPIVYYAMNKRFRYYFQKALCLCCFTNNTFNSETYSRKYSVSHMTHYNVNDRRVSINNDGRRMSSNSPMGRKLSSISFVPGDRKNNVMTRRNCASFSARERKRSFPDTSQFKSPDSLQLPRKYNNEKMNSNGSIMTNSSYSGVSFSKQGDDVFLRTLETSAEDQDSVFL